MKWLCKKCKSINTEFAYECHNCGGTASEVQVVTTVSASGTTNDSARIYPCERCGKMRSKDEGGTIFTVCDECWDIVHQDDTGR